MARPLFSSICIFFLAEPFLHVELSTNCTFRATSCPFLPFSMALPIILILLKRLQNRSLLHLHIHRNRNILHLHLLLFRHLLRRQLLLHLSTFQLAVCHRLHHLHQHYHHFSLRHLHRLLLHLSWLDFPCTCQVSSGSPHLPLLLQPSIS